MAISLLRVRRPELQLGHHAVRPTIVLPSTMSRDPGGLVDDVEKPPVETIGPIDPAALGAALARSVLGRSGYLTPGLVDFATRMNVPRDRLQAELAHVSIITMHFCIGVVFGAGADAAIVDGFYRTLWAAPPWCATERGWRSRVREYQHLLSQPHPEHGRAYGVGRAFARLCGASHDVAVIELGATAFVEQLAPILGLLRTVRVAGAGEAAPA
jgi:hypothetical protein